MSVIDRTRAPVGTSRRSTWPTLPWTVLFLDVLTLAVVGVLAIVGRETLDVFDPPRGLRVHMDVVGPLILLGWLTMIALFGGYQRDVLGAGTDEFKRVLNASLATAGLVGIACYLAKFDLARGFFVLAFLLGPATLLLVRLVARGALHRLRRRGLASVRVLIAGTPTGIDKMTQILRRENWLGYSVIGGVVPAPAPAHEETPTGIPILGTVDDLTDLADQQATDMVLFAEGGSATAEDTKNVIYALERHHVHVAMTPRIDDISHDRIRIRPVGGVPIIHVASPTWARAGALGKRIFDVAVGSTLVVALSPVFLTAMAAIWLHDRGPLLFRQTRIGRDEVPFTCLKFRTMRADAEALIEDLIDDSDQTALLFKMKDDPRVTKPGKWLRRFSIDELPQLINVVRGDMSLVGPRPQVDREVALYEGVMSRRLLVRPGMTGLWQVSGRNDLTPEEAIRLDVYYVDNWSMMQDLSILVRTVNAVLSSRGAY